MTKKSILPGCLAVFGLVVVVAGGGYLYLSGKLPWQKFTPLEAAKVIPQEAFATSFINTDAEAWAVLAKYGTPATREAVNRGLVAFQKRLAIDNLDYETDIQPWISGVTFAFLPVSPKGELGLLMVVGIKDKLQALEFAQKMQQQKHRTTTESDYKGVKITEMTTQPLGKTYMAVVGDYLLMAADRRVVETAIETSQGKPAYHLKPGVKELLSQSLDIAHPLARVYIDDYAQLLASGRNLPIETLQKSKKVQGLVAGVGSAAGGLHFQGVAKLDPTTLINLPSPTNSQVLTYFPQETIAFWSGNNLKQGWTELDRQARTDANVQEVVRQIRQGLQMAALDADKEVFGWMDREFAIGMIPSDQALGGSGIGGLMVWETSDRKTAEKTLDKLNQLAKFAPTIVIETAQIDGKPVTQWTTKGQILLTYGWLDQDSLAMTVAIPYQGQPSTPMTRSPNFQASIAELPQPNLGYFYLDLVQIFAKMGGLNRVPATVLNPEAKAFLESVKGITVTATQPDQTTGKIDALLTLKEVP